MGGEFAVIIGVVIMVALVAGVIVVVMSQRKPGGSRGAGGAGGPAGADGRRGPGPSLRSSTSRGTTRSCISKCRFLPEAPRACCAIC